MSVFFSNALVGGMTTLALVLLFWPLVQAGMRKAKGG
jgi:hypothetical protein